MKAATDDCIYAMDDMEISIHAAREGGDEQPVALTELPKAFQSTPPVKAATGL